MSKGPTDVVLVTAGYDHCIKYWNVVDCVCTHSIQHNESHINRLAISTDKSRLAVAGNPCIRVYDNVQGQAGSASPTAEQASPVLLLEGHHSNVTAVGWQWEGRWVWSASEDGTARVWDLRAGSASKCQREFVGKYPVCDAALHPNQTELATVDERGVLRVWALAGRECVYETVPEVSAQLPVCLQSVSYSPDGTLIACCNSEGRVFVYDRTDGKYSLQHTIQAHDTYITRLAFSPDGLWLCTCSADGTSRLFAVQSGFGMTRSLSGHQRWVWDCTFSADSAYLLTASSDGSARLFESRSGDLISVFAGHSKAITCIALNDIP